MRARVKQIRGCGSTQRALLDVADAGAGDAEVVRLQVAVGVDGQQFTVDVLLPTDGALTADLTRLALVPGKDVTSIIHKSTSTRPQV